MPLFRWLSNLRPRSAAASPPTTPSEAPPPAPEDDPVALEQCNAERQRVIDDARSKALWDGVFAILLYNQHNRRLGPPPHASYVELAEAFPAVAEPELAQAEARAGALLQCAFTAGDAYLAASVDIYEKLVNQLATENPGFARESYDRTIGYGCWQAR